MKRHHFIKCCMLGLCLAQAIAAVCQHVPTLLLKFSGSKNPINRIFSNEYVIVELPFLRTATVKIAAGNGHPIPVATAVLQQSPLRIAFGPKLQFADGAQLHIYLQGAGVNGSEPIAEPIYRLGPRPGFSSGDSAAGLVSANGLASATIATVPVEAEGIQLKSDGIGSRQGTGIVISSDGLVVTCDHVVHGASTIWVRYRGNDYAYSRVSGPLADKWADSDIAFLQVSAVQNDVGKTSLNDFVTARLINPSVSADYRATLQDARTDLAPAILRAQVVGFRSSERASLSSVDCTLDEYRSLKDGDIPIYRTKPYLLTNAVTALPSEITEEPLEGMSGGPLVSHDGNVVGMLHRNQGSTIALVDASAIISAAAELKLKITENLLLGPVSGSQAKTQSKTIHLLVDGLQQLSLGKTHDAASSFNSAILNAQTRDESQEVLLAYAQLGTSAGHEATAFCRRWLKRDLPNSRSIAPAIAALLHLSANGNELPRDISILALQSDNTQVCQSGMGLLESLGSNLITQAEKAQVSELSSDWWLGSEAISCLDRLSRNTFEIQPQFNVLNPKTESEVRLDRALESLNAYRARSAFAALRRLKIAPTTTLPGGLSTVTAPEGIATVSHALGTALDGSAERDLPGVEAGERPFLQFLLGTNVEDPDLLSFSGARILRWESPDSALPLLTDTLEKVSKEDPMKLSERQAEIATEAADSLSYLDPAGTEQELVKAYPPTVAPETPQRTLRVGILQALLNIRNVGGIDSLASLIKRQGLRTETNKDGISASELQSAMDDSSCPRVLATRLKNELAQNGTPVPTLFGGSYAAREQLDSAAFAQRLNGILASFKTVTNSDDPVIRDTLKSLMSDWTGPAVQPGSTNELADADQRKSLAHELLAGLCAEGTDVTIQGILKYAKGPWITHINRDNLTEATRAAAQAELEKIPYGWQDRGMITR